MSPRDRIAKVIAELEALQFDWRSEFEKDWHGYVGEAVAALRAAIGDQGQPTDVDRHTHVGYVPNPNDSTL